MTSEQAFQAHKNASSVSVSRYGGTTWAAGSGSVDLEIEAEDEPPGAARLNPGDTTQTHMGDNINTVAASATNQSVDHASTVISHANDQSAADTTTSARVDGSHDAPASAPAHTVNDPDEDSLPDISTFIRPDATGYVPVDGARVSTELLSGLDPTAADRVGVSVSWVNPKLRACTSTTGSGMFAIQPITKGEHLIVWTGKIVTAEEALAVMETDDKHYLLQIGDGFYQTPLSRYREPADYTNHSCEPTAGFGKGSPVCLSAMRDIPVGGQVLFDYGMCETDPRLWEPMECLCGTPSCRKWITANDWYLYPELWERYAGFWSPHVQRQIDAYRADLDKKKQQQVGADIPAADITPTTSASASASAPTLKLPTLQVMDSPAFTPMQVSSTSPSSSGSSSPVSRASTPVSSASPPSSPHGAPDMLLPSARLSQAKAKAKAKLAKQVVDKVNKKKSPTAGIHFETTSSSSSSSSGDESDVEDGGHTSPNATTNDPSSNTTTSTTGVVIKQEYIEAVSTPFYLQWMDRMLAAIGLQRIKA